MKHFFIICVKCPITSTTITKRNTVKKENLTNKKVFLTYKKGLLPYKQDLLTYTKKDLLTYIKNPRQTLTANSHGKFLLPTYMLLQKSWFSKVDEKGNFFVECVSYIVFPDLWTLFFTFYCGLFARKYVFIFESSTDTPNSFEILFSVQTTSISTVF